MPFDKSRIQGFGSDGPAPSAGSSTNGGGGGSSVVKVMHCPAGHELRRWMARQGWCDQCGRKVAKGEQVMDCRLCNWYLCDTCCPHEAQGSSLWGAFSSLSDSMAVQSAIDSVALRFGDVIDAATQEMTEMATEVKSFVTSSMGMQDDDDEDQASSEAGGKQTRPSNDAGTSQQRQEAAQVISEFCEKYPATRVAPNSDELEQLWSRCSNMHVGPVASALYDQLSFSGGELEWQPRLRVLYVLEFLNRKGGNGKEIAHAAAHHAGGLLQHLVQVQQCKEKASQVVLMLMGKAAALEAGATLPEETGLEANGKAGDKEGKAAEKPKAMPKPAAAKKAAVDLLDLATPVPEAAPMPNGTQVLDLLSAGKAEQSTAAAVPSDLLLLGPSAAATSAEAPRAGAGPEDLLGGLLLMPSSSSSAEQPFNPSGVLSSGVSPLQGAQLRPGPAMPGQLPLTGFAALSQAPSYPPLGACGGFSGTAPLAWGAAPALGSGPGFASSPFRAAPMPGAQPGMMGFGIGAGAAPMWGPLQAAGGLPAAAAGGMPGGAVPGGLPRWPPASPSGHSSHSNASPSAKALAASSKLYNIPAASDLTPLHESTSPDPFAFVSQHTGLNDAK